MNKYAVVVATVFGWSTGPVLAQAPDIEELDLERLLDTPVTVTTGRALSVRESPGILTVLTRDEILASGATDLMGVLQLVPGVHAMSDVQGSSTFIVRGVASSDGKQLVLLDGQIMNELMYGWVLTEGRFPLDLIERIEVIRGPGSIVYGDLAELTVVNIVTRGAEHFHGVGVYGAVGQHQDVDARQLGSALLAQRIGDAKLSVSAYGGRWHRSNRAYADYYGDRYALTDGGRIFPLYANAGFEWRGFKARGIVEDYELNVRDVYDGSTAAPYTIRYRTVRGDVSYELKLHDKATLTPWLRYHRDQPWRVSETDFVDSAGQNPYYMKTAERLHGGTTLRVDLVDGLDLLAGLEGRIDHGRVDTRNEVGFQTFFSERIGFSSIDGMRGGRQNLWLGTFGTFAQLASKSFIGNFTVGARYEQNSRYGHSFVPRTAFTRVFDNFHVKVLASRAYRAPNIENIAGQLPGERIRPEFSTVFEVEAGYQLPDLGSLTVNWFDITVDRPIIYSYDPDTNSEGYGNEGRLGSRGVELEGKLRFTHAWVNTSYSYYTEAGKNRVFANEVAGPSGATLGQPQHKVTLLASFDLVKDLSFAPSAIWVSERVAYPNDPELQETLPATAQVDAFFHYKNALVDGLRVSLGVQNMLDADFQRAQGSASYHPPIPNPGRELVLKAGYEFQP